MGTVKRVLIGLFSVAFLLTGVTIVTPFGSEAEAGRYYKRHKRVSHKDLRGDHKELGEWIEKVEKKLEDLEVGGGGEGNHTLRWDTVLDSTNGSTDIGAEGCNSDRFKCIMPTTAFPDGEAVLDLQTGQVWDRSPHDPRGGTDTAAGDKKTWSSARFQCANRVMGGQKGQRLPSFAELGSLVDPNPTVGNPDLPPGHPFIGVQSFFYWSATTVADISTNAWGVFFFSGTVGPANKTLNSFVWCVRSGHNDGSQY